jgi:hypothetical protein
MDCPINYTVDKFYPFEIIIISIGLIFIDFVFFVPVVERVFWFVFSRENTGIAIVDICRFSRGGWVRCDDFSVLSPGLFFARKERVVVVERRKF